MFEAGSGHVSPAVAIEESINKNHESVKVDVIELANASGASNTGDKMKKTWNKIISIKSMAMITYILMELFYPISKLYLRIFSRQMVKKGMNYINEYNPDIIFSTHFFCTTIATLAREKYNMDCKVISYVTDPFDAFSFWAEKRADCICVASKKAKQMLIEKGIAEEKVKVVDFLLREKFTEKIAKDRKKKLMTQYEINDQFKTVLATDGGEGIGGFYRYIEKIYEKDFPINIIAVCGRNTELLGKLNLLKKRANKRTNMVTFGFVDNMYELIDLADFTIGKAGASTVFESLIKEKPIIITSCSIQHEARTVDYVVSNKLGWYPKNMIEFFEIVEDIVYNNRAEEYRKNIIKQNIKSGAEELADFIIENMESQTQEVSLNPAYPEF